MPKKKFQINLKTPKFWLKVNLISIILLPFSLIYLIAYRLKYFFSHKRKINNITICIGNLIAGGAGKTPFAIALGDIIKQRIAINFCYLTRGYKGRNLDFAIVDNDLKKQHYLGDESLILSSHYPTFIARNRLLALQKISQDFKKFKITICDDGLQDKKIDYDIKIIIIDGNIAFGNNLLIPAGPLRETIYPAIIECDFIAIINSPNNKKLQQIINNFHNKIIYTQIISKNIGDFSQKKLWAFTGIAYPDKFFDFLISNNLIIIKNTRFADHYNYSQEELEMMIIDAKKMGLTLITTEKDWIKFPANIKNQIEYLAIEINIINPELIIRKINNLGLNNFS